MKERVIDWFRENFSTDHSGKGFPGVMFPDILICNYYKTKKDLKEGMFNCLGNSESVRKSWEWLDGILFDDNGDMILSLDIYSLDELIDTYNKEIDIQ